MPSYLGEYEGCATDRNNKFIRAVYSFLNNSYSNKELIIVSDGCQETVNLVRNTFNEFIQNKLIRLVFLRKQKLFSGKLRSEGIKHATGDYIIYLDSDDMIGDKHIQSIVEQMRSNNYDWAYYNDFIYGESGLNTKLVEPIENSIGTSSIVHKNVKKINWDGCDGYGHDFKFIQKLLKWSENYSKIYGMQYIICHIPNVIDK